MNEPKKPHLPIGYWIRRADELLTARIDEAQRVNGLSRTEWQVLNVLREAGAASGEEVHDTMRPFADSARLRGVLSRLAERGLVTGLGGAEDGYRLTEEGVRLYEGALALQKDVRRRAMEGVSEAEYAAAVRVLQRLVENPEQDGGFAPG